MLAYSSKLEDTPWCMDLSVSSTDGSDIYYGAVDRNAEEPFEPSVACPTEYQLKVSTTDPGLKLKYPVALLTADEITLAGSGYAYWSGYSSDAYLNISDFWWTLSPGAFNDSAFVFCVDSDSGGALHDGFYTAYPFGVRPSISLAPGTELTGNGDGTAENPYVVS